MKHTKFWAILGVSALASLAFGCSDSEQSNGASADAAELTSAEVALTAEDLPALSDADMKRFGDHLNAFSYGFEQVAARKGSYVFSPFSYHSALSMAAFGANGNTYDEMASALKFEGDKAAAASLNGGMRLKLRYDGQAEKSKFEIANRIWVDQTSEVVPAFSDAMDKYYKAPLKIVDFGHNYAKYIGVINAWVSNNTSGMIKDLLKDGDLSADTCMVLVNAIHFDGDWAIPFKAAHTHDSKFKTGAAEQTVKMMNLDAHQIVYYRSEAHPYQVASMDYVGGKFAMMIVLPDDVDGLRDVAAALDASELRKIQNGLAEHNGNIFLPKFKIETEIDSDTNIRALSALGMHQAFTNSADFSEMVSNRSPYINKVIHKAVIEVDEKGTKAAAATAVEASDTAIFMEDDFIQFRADHPFAFVLYHKASGAVLFAGQYWGM